MWSKRVDLVLYTHENRQIHPDTILEMVCCSAISTRFIDTNIILISYTYTYILYKPTPDNFYLNHKPSV